MRTVNRISGIEGVSPGSKPTIKAKTARRYHGFKFFTTAAGVACDPSLVISRVRQSVNGGTVRDLTVARMLKIAKLNGVVPGLNELPIFYSEPARADKIDEQMLAWDMSGETSFEIEFSMTAEADPGITGIEIFDLGHTMLDGKIVKNIVRQVEVNKGGNQGPNDFDNLPVRDALLRILLDTTATINSVEVTADRNKVYEVLKAENARVLADYGLDATAFSFPVCFDFTEQVIGDSLRVRDLNVRFDLSAAAGVTAVVESLASGF